MRSMPVSPVSPGLPPAPECVCSLTLSHSPSLSLTLSHSPSLSLTLSHSLSLSLTLSHSLSLSGEQHSLAWLIRSLVVRVSR